MTQSILLSLFLLIVGVHVPTVSAAEKYTYDLFHTRERLV